MKDLGKNGKTPTDSEEPWLLSALLRCVVCLQRMLLIDETTNILEKVTK